MLYVHKGRKNEYICYQDVLRSRKNQDHPACTSRIRRLTNGLCERVNKNIPHSPHPDHEVIVSDKKIMESVVQKCQALKLNHPEDAFKIPNRHIFQREIAKYEYCIETIKYFCALSISKYIQVYFIYITSRVGNRNTRLNYSQVKRTIARKKNSVYPKIPRSIQQFQKEFLKPEILNEYGYTLDGDARFYLGTEIAEEYAFAVFYSDYVVKFIKEKIPVGSRFYLMDGTFDSLPEGVYQLLTISIAYDNNVSV